MQTEEDIRIKLLEIKLTALETQYCNTNWAFTCQLKELKQQLQLKQKKQADLNEELRRVRAECVEHAQEVKHKLKQMTDVCHLRKSEKLGSKNVSLKQNTSLVLIPRRQEMSMRRLQRPQIHMNSIQCKNPQQTSKPNGVTQLIKRKSKDCAKSGLLKNKISVNSFFTDMSINSKRYSGAESPRLLKTRFLQLK